MSYIRVNPAELREAAGEIEQAAGEYRGLAERALGVSRDAPSYDGQFGPQVWAAGDEAHSRLSGLAGQLTALSQELVRIAEAFEAADAESVAGMLALGVGIESLYGTSLTRLSLSLLRPAHISEKLWSMLPLEDRVLILRGLGVAFPLSSSSEPGTVLYVTNPLRVRRQPGLNGEIYAYATAGSQVTYTGHSRTADGIEWYQVTHKNSLGELVTGWVSSYYLSTGRSRVGFDPRDVPDLYDIQTNLEVQESGGSLMSVTSNWLQIRDGPTGDYAVQVAPALGQVVRWTGRSIEEGEHTWYEVTTWRELDDGKLEPVIGWARGDRVADYAPPVGATAPEEGFIYVPETGEWNASYYTVTDVNAYASVQHRGDGFDRLVPIPWREGFRPEGVDGDILVPYGSLYTPEGVAMQGSGKVTLENGEVLYFQLNNPADLEWQDASGHHVSWERGKQWVTDGGNPSFPAEISNSESAEFRPGPRATELVPGVSVAAPRDLAGTTLYIPELREFSEDPERPGVFEVADTGGAFGPGEQRIDVFYESFDAGREWHNRTYGVRHDGLTIFVARPIPPELEQTAGP